MKQHQKTIGDNDEWFTPPEIIKALGTFDLDPADTKTRWCFNLVMPPTANTSYCVDGLDPKTIWKGRVWLNPPFNRYERPKWMKRMAEHNNGIMLIPAACETDAFYKYVWDKATGICFLKGRPHFYDTSGVIAKANSGCTICLVAYGEMNYNALSNSGLGYTTRINH